MDSESDHDYNERPPIVDTESEKRSIVSNVNELSAKSEQKSIVSNVNSIMSRIQ